jgi:hypothetical protein
MDEGMQTNFTDGDLPERGEKRAWKTPGAASEKVESAGISPREETGIGTPDCKTTLRGRNESAVNSRWAEACEDSIVYREFSITNKGASRGDFFLQDPLIGEK